MKRFKPGQSNKSFSKITSFFLKKEDSSKIATAPCCSSYKEPDPVEEEDEICRIEEESSSETTVNSNTPTNIEYGLVDEEVASYVTVNSSENIVTTKIKKDCKKRYVQKYVASWEGIEEFKGWLCKAEKGSLAYCKVCEQTITCGKSELLRHSKSSRHKQLIKSVKNTQDMATMLTTPLTMKVRRGELKWAAMLAENNLPMSLMDTLIPLAASIYEDSQVAANMKLKRTKTTGLLKNVLAPHFNTSLCSKLKNNKFSLIMDETTDLGSIKQCAFTVIFFDKEVNELKVQYLHMVECASGDANNLYKTLKETLEKNGIPMENMVGFCSDTTAVMAGSHHSVFTELKKELPQICLLKCSSHQLHLAGSWACNKLPKEVEDLLRNIYAHFHRSYQRQVILKEFQAFYEVDEHNILRSSQTRWLSLKQSVDRVLEQYEPLTRYFMVQVFEDCTPTTEYILKTLKLKSTKCYLQFLSYVLDLLTGLNVLFQTDGPVLVKLQPEISNLIKNLSLNFLNTKYVRETDAYSIDVYDECQYLAIEDIYIGVNTLEMVNELKETDEEAIKMFYKNCQNFYITLVAELKKRFVFSDKCFSFLNVLKPSDAQNLCVRSLKVIFDRFSNYLYDVKLQDADSEWRQHSLIDHESLGLNPDLSVLDYWKRVFSLKNAAEQHVFPNLKTVISLLMCLPSSNASVERVFSQLKLIKTCHRNQLKTDTINAIMHTKHGVRDCVMFEPPRKLLEKRWK